MFSIANKRSFVTISVGSWRFRSMRRADVVIIGAGFGGVCAAIRCRKAGLSFVVLEKGDSPGGVWRDNGYPGACCDVPSLLYSYSFEPKHDWGHIFARRD